MNDLPWTAAAAAAVGADWLLSAIAPAGDFGRRARLTERAFRRGDEASAEAALTRIDSLARDIPAERLAALSEAIAAAPDPASALVRAGGGGVLDDVDFFELTRFLDAVAEIAARATHPLFAAIVPQVPAAALGDALALGRTASRTFYLCDEFAPELAVLRGEAAAARARFDLARGRLAERVARYAGLEHVRDGEFVLMRERIVEPLVAEIRVLREAPTYLLCELALDATAISALRDVERGDGRVADAEERVRTRLSASVAAAAPELERAALQLGALDLLVARVRFAVRFGCTLPLIERDAEIAFEDARYLPLAGALEERERAYVPLSLELAGLGVLTGPNMGGKTAALRTLGFLVACVALGVPVPAQRARIPLVDDLVWLGLSSLPEDDALLSAFGTEIVALREFLERSPERALVLSDEFARTTSPHEGRALLVALLETLRVREVVGLAATHFAGIAASASLPHYRVGGPRALEHGAGERLELRAALERIARETDYRVTRVAEDAAPHADALALAEALGLDAELLARARAAL